MKITGKTKEAFEKWLEDTDNLCGLDLFQLPDTCIDTLIIEFFDSVGIYIWTMPSLRVETKWTFRVFKTLLEDYVNQHAYIYNTRQEATGKAIEKANEIYNEMLNKC